MSLTYERGDPNAPKGHALLYFYSATDESRVHVTYLICLPIAIDLVKYMPPLLAPHVAGISAQEMSAFAFPPVPEEMGSHRRLTALAQTRDDDLLFGGTVDLSQVPSMLSTVNEIVQEYGHAYRAVVGSIADELEESEEPMSELSVSEVLYGLMSDRDRLAELAQLTGKLRFAAEGGDVRQLEEAEHDVRALAKHLPEHYKVEALAQAAKTATPGGGELAGLYLDRCFKLADEDYLRLKEIEERIQALETIGSGDEGPTASSGPAG
jgi:hypothetical protein